MMTAKPPKQAPAQAIYRKRGFSYVWITPLLALIVVGWTGWTSWRDKGPTIHIVFLQTDGIDVNRTLIKHKGVTLGTVTGIAPSKDFSHVVVTAQMDAVADQYLTTNTKFWVVHPRVSVGSISDLNTLVSGIYIELAPGAGDKTLDFTGREEPLAVDQQEPGRNFTLKAPELRSLEAGSPVYFHGVPAGQVTTFELDDDKNVLVHIFIRAPYDRFVLEQTRFWNVSGIGITAGAEGIKISAQSLQAVVQGGITFDLPAGIASSKQAAPQTMFPLYADREAAFDSAYIKKLRYVMHFIGSTQGLETGAAVTLLGNRIGRVVQTFATVDDTNGTARSEVVVDIQPDRIQYKGSLRTTDSEQRARSALRNMVSHKLRAQLASSNLLTGQKSIDLEYVDDAPAASITSTVSYPELPTAPSGDFATVMQDAHVTLKHADTFIQNIEPQVAPVLKGIKDTTDRLNTNQGNGGLSGTLAEIKQAARAIRDLTEYLDAHPEAILQGKAEP